MNDVCSSDKQRKVKETRAQEQGVYVLYQISKDQDADIIGEKTKTQIHTLSRKKIRGYHKNNRID